MDGIFIPEQIGTSSTCADTSYFLAFNTESRIIALIMECPPWIDDNPGWASRPSPAGPASWAGRSARPCWPGRPGMDYGVRGLRMFEGACCAACAESQLGAS